MISNAPQTEKKLVIIKPFPLYSEVRDDLLPYYYTRTCNTLIKSELFEYNETYLYSLIDLFNLLGLEFLI
jgi:hypothetical protein